MKKGRVSNQTLTRVVREACGEGHNTHQLIWPTHHCMTESCIRGGIMPTSSAERKHGVRADKFCTACSSELLACVAGALPLMVRHSACVPTAQANLCGVLCGQEKCKCCPQLAEAQARLKMSPVRDALRPSA